MQAGSIMDDGKVFFIHLHFFFIFLKPEVVFLPFIYLFVFVSYKRKYKACGCAFFCVGNTLKPQSKSEQILSQQLPRWHKEIERMESGDFKTLYFNRSSPEKATY